MDRKQSKNVAFEIGDGSKKTYLKIALKIKERYIVNHLCTDGNPLYKHYKIAEYHHITKSETLAW